MFYSNMNYKLSYMLFVFPSLEIYGQSTYSDGELYTYFWSNYNIYSVVNNPTIIFEGTYRCTNSISCTIPFGY